LKQLHLQSTELDSSNLGQIHAFRTLLAKATRLRQVKLQETGLDDEFVGKVRGALMETRLRILDLSMNQITTRGALTLA
jgi:Ran GTPase-activating protein (RanGAP) involved in mRNA processing and transport